MGNPPPEAPIPRQANSKTKKGEGSKRGEERKKGQLGLEGRGSPTSEQWATFIEMVSLCALGAPLRPENGEKMEMLHFSPDSRGARAAGPALARLGRKGVEPHNGHA